MEIFIKDRKTFATKHYYLVSEYQLYIGTSTDTKGSIKLPAELRDIAGDWLLAKGRFWIIDSAVPDNGFTNCKLADPINFFKRTLFYIPPIEATAGSFIRDTMLREYITQSDLDFRYDYLSCEDTSAVPFFEPEQDEGTFSLGVYMKDALNAGLGIDFELVNGGLRVSIRNAERKRVPVFFDDGHAVLESSVFGENVYSKVTVRKPKDEESYEDKIFYLAADGQVSETVPDKRAPGLWEIIICREDEEPREIAEQLFRDNAFSYKVTFYSDRRYNHLDTAVLMLPSGKFEAPISEVIIKSGDNRYMYQCGEKITTITDSVRAVNNTISGEATAGENTTALAAYPVGSIYMSVNAVSPAALFGGTWRQIQGRFLLGCSTKYVAGATGGEEEHTLTVDEIPAHSHAGLAYNGGTGGIRGTSSGGTTTGQTGGGQAHNNMPPYLSVYIWERTG